MCLSQLWFSQGICSGVGILGHIYHVFYNSNGSSSEDFLPSLSLGLDVTAEMKRESLLKVSAFYMGEGNGNPLQYSYLENPMDGGAWWAAVHRVIQSQTQLKRLSMHACIGEGHGHPLQYSCLENPRDRGAWYPAVYGVTQNRTRLKRLSSSSSLLHHSPKCG